MKILKLISIVTAFALSLTIFKRLALYLKNKKKNRMAKLA